MRYLVVTPLGARRAREWRGALGNIVFFAGDIEGAFDNLHPCLVADSLEGMGAPPNLIAALLHECFEMHSTPMFTP